MSTSFSSGQFNKFRTSGAGFDDTSSIRGTKTPNCVYIAICTSCCITNYPTTQWLKATKMCIISQLLWLRNSRESYLSSSSSGSVTWNKANVPVWRHSARRNFLLHRRRQRSCSVQSVSWLDETHPSWRGHLFTQSIDLNVKLIQNHPESCPTKYLLLRIWHLSGYE